jgi:hypothetical protein
MQAGVLHSPGLSGEPWHVKMLRYYLLICCAAILVGCGPPPQGVLEKLSAGLRRGMTKEEVRYLFDGPPAHESDWAAPNGFGVGGGQLFETNVIRGTLWSYSCADGILEVCTIYFNTNGIIAGYAYSRSGAM